MTQKILYILTPGTNISPFDVTLAADAGFEQVLPFTGIKLRDVVPMVQDSIFARPPGRFNDTGVFIGGRDVHLAKDMLDAAAKAMVGPFQVGVFADPNGAYTTSASVLALVNNALKEKTSSDLTGKKVCVFGAGPVGQCIAVLTARQGAKTKLCQLTAEDDQRTCVRFAQRYDADVEWVSTQTYNEKADVVKEAEIIICAAKAGVRILDVNVMNLANDLIVAADTNAVPPSGIDAVDAQDNGIKENNSGKPYWSIGSLAIGNLKYKTQFGLFEKIQQSETAALIDFPDAFDFATGLLASMQEKDKAA